MSLSLNTGHALYGNIIEYIGVDAGALVSLVTSRTFTNRANPPSFGTGTYGAHMQTDGNSYSWSGVTFSPALSYATHATGSTIFAVFNSIGGGGLAWAHDTNAYFESFAVNGSGKATVYMGYVPTNRSGTPAGATLNDSAAHSVCVNRVAGDGPVALKVYSDGSLADTGSDPGFGSSGALINSLGGLVGNTGPAMKLVHLVVFNKVLSATEVSDLHASLGANNAIAILNSTTSDLSGSAALGDITASGGAGGGSPSDVSGGATLGDITASGGMSVSTSDVSGSATLGDITAAGTLAQASGTITSQAFKNNTGTVLPAITVPKVACIRLSDMVMVLSLTNQVTDGSGQLVITSTSLVTGVQYLLVTSDAGAVNFGCEPYTAT